jgi:hypothetical protein
MFYLSLKVIKLKKEKIGRKILLFLGDDFVCWLNINILSESVLVFSQLLHNRMNTAVGCNIKTNFITERERDGLHG